MAVQAKFPHAGKKYTIKFGNGLVVMNTYAADGKTVLIEFLSGHLMGSRMSVPFEWSALPGNNYLISWQEDDKSTVVHCDNFDEKLCRAFYTTMSGDFYVMIGEMI